MEETTTMNAQAMVETATAPQAEEPKVKEKKPRTPRKKAATPRKKKTEVATEKKTEPLEPLETLNSLESSESLETLETLETLEKPEEKKPLVFVKPRAVIKNIVDLTQAPQRQIILSDQQIQQLTLEDAEERHMYLEQMLMNVLDYDVVISDTNIWLELLVGHTSSHSDPRVNARLQFERQMEFISKMIHRRKGMFMMMAETYEEIDRFATSQEPANYQDADFQDQNLCLNVAARLAKRLILSMQRENRLRIEGIGAESHHAAFADPAIIRRTVEFFAQGKKVLLITNDASVGIRSLGLCDDLQRYNNIDDERWDEVYVPIRPMVITFDDLKLLDQYTRQYHFIQQAAGKMWMEDITTPREKREVPVLRLWMEAFRPGDRHRTPLPQMNIQQQAKQKQEQPKQKPQQEQKQKQKPQPKPQQKKVEEQPKPEEKAPEVKVEAPIPEEVKAPEETPKTTEDKSKPTEDKSKSTEDKSRNTEDKPKPKRRGGGRRPKKAPAPESSNNQ